MSSCDQPVERQRRGIIPAQAIGLGKLRNEKQTGLKARVILADDLWR